MAGENDFGPIPHQVLDGGHGRPDPSIVGDIPVRIEGHVKIRPHEHSLPLEVGGGEVPDALLRHGRHAPGAPPAPPGDRPDPRRHVDRQQRVHRSPGEAQAVEGRSERDGTAGGGKSDRPRLPPGRRRGCGGGGGRAKRKGGGGCGGSHRELLAREEEREERVRKGKR